MMNLLTLTYSEGDKMSVGVYCDECNELFGIKNYEKLIPGTDITEHRFDCPHCKHSYLSYVTNEEIKGNMKKIQELLKTNRYFRNQDKIERLRKQNAILMDELKGTLTS